MRFELDHLFVCTDPGAPEAGELVEFGLREGKQNQHPGQGTSNRRFPFANAMIELLWVSNRREAERPEIARTLLWDRWSNRKGNASPFGICFRPGEPGAVDSPFPSWEYSPEYLPRPTVMHIAETGIEEPMWVYLNFMRKQYRAEQFAEHPVGLREITGLRVFTRIAPRSVTSRIFVESGILSMQVGEESLLEIEFDDKRRGSTKDFRPALPIIFRF